MKLRWHFVRAVLRRELTSYFSSPTGYVFITLFVFLSAIAAFWQETFFASNLANLDPLNRWFPYFLVFLVPAITMTSWAEEKRTGTAELLLTLPATDVEVVLGKYLSALSIYTVALLFSISHLLVLVWLGSPDLGLMLSTYLGYWLMGAALIGLGMLASQLTDNLTVAFILGSVLCAIPVFIQHAGVIVAGGLRTLLEGLSFIEQFEDLASGVVSLSSLAYFSCFAAAMVLFNVVLLGRRHWPSGKQRQVVGWHQWARGAAVIVTVASLSILFAQIGGRLDFTAEGIHSISGETQALIDSLDPNRPVFIQAFLSPEVPRAYLQARNNIVTMLREFDAMGGSRIYARIVETEKYSEEAREAQDRYNIRPRPVAAWQQTAGGPTDVFMGIAFSSGAEETVIDFFEPGLPVEYELMRSIRVVANAERKKIGVLETQAKLFGGFDFESKQRSSDWSIVAELRKQYEVARVQPNSDYPTDLDVLVAVLPNTLEEEEMGKLVDYLKEGKPTLLLVDPLPAFNIELSPQIAPRNPFSPNAPQRMPANTQPLMEALGVQWNRSLIAWDKYNPHPQFGSLPPEVTFVAEGNEASEQPFHPEQPVTSGLQEVVVLYGGVLTSDEGAKTEFTPLLTTGADSGTTQWHRLVQRSIFGVQLATNLAHEPDDETHVIAARVTGTEDHPANAIVIADVDMMGEQFFQLRRQGVGNLNFDNVTFLLNAVDQLAGDESFIALRKRRRKHRTLEAVEARTRVYEERRLEETQQAEQNAEQRLQEAQERLDKAVEELRQRTDLDVRQKQVRIANLEQIENRRLNVARTNIEDEKQRRIERSRADMEQSIRGIQNTIKVLAVAIPPIPAFALFIVVSVRRLRRERASVSADRLIREKR